MKFKIDDVVVRKGCSDPLIVAGSEKDGMMIACKSGSMESNEPAHNLEFVKSIDTAPEHALEDFVSKISPMVSDAADIHQTLKVQWNQFRRDLGAAYSTLQSKHYEAQGVLRHAEAMCKMLKNKSSFGAFKVAGNDLELKAQTACSTAKKEVDKIEKIFLNIKKELRDLDDFRAYW